MASIKQYDSKISQKDANIISLRTATYLSIVIVLGYLSLTIIFSGNTQLRGILSDIITPLISLLVIIALLYSLKVLKACEHSAYKAWLFLTLAQISFFIGDVIWAVLEVGFGVDPFPSIADLFYLAYYPLFALGVYLLLKITYKPRKTYKVLLDMSIVIVASFLFFWSLLIMPTIEMGSNDIIGILISLIYISLDFALLLPLLDLIFKRAKSLNDKVPLLLAGSIASQIFIDAIFVNQNIYGISLSGSPFETFWILSYVLLGLAGITEANRAKLAIKERLIPEEPYKFSWTIYLPYYLIFGAYIMLVAGYKTYSAMNLVVLEVGVGFTIFMVFIRQTFALRENQELFINAQEEIRKRKETEKTLKTERDRAQTYFNISGVILLVLNKKGEVKLINKKGCEVLGYEKKEIEGKDWFFNFVAAKDQDKIKSIFKDALEGRVTPKMAEVESSVLNKNGEERIIMWHNTVLNDENGNITGTLSSGEDVTRRKNRERELKEKADETIRRQEALLYSTRLEVHNLSDAFKRLIETDAMILNVERVSIWFFNEDKTEILCQSIFQKDLDSHVSGDVLKAQDYPHYFEAIKKSHNIAASDAQSDPQTREFADSYLKPLGIVSMLDVPIWLRGELFGVLCHEHVGDAQRSWSFEDQDFAVSVANLISRYIESDERRKAEEKIKESLNEKEILLREIHHRVKNNMQVISSLLNLQSRYIEDEEDRNIFKESQNRVRSMAIVHEMLYQSPDLARINLGDYIKNLTKFLCQSYSARNRNIELETHIEDIQMEIDTAIPLGLIINELVSNSLKHAFVTGQKGQIMVGVQSTDDEFMITVSDNGRGFPEELDFKKTKTLGLQLVNTLINQIKGEIELERDGGTKFIIKFKG